MCALPIAAVRLSRSSARLSDRAFLQLIVDLGQFDAPISPETSLTAPQVSAILALYHADSGPGFLVALHKAA